ncbi:MAG: hypothetical protein ACLQVX_04665 [Limisphaerales bacterium]
MLVIHNLNSAPPLLDNEPGSSLIKWLNSLPEVQVILAPIAPNPPALKNDPDPN